jgi:hypothetical protein
MNCDTVREQLGAYADGELAAELAAQVERHTRECPACAAEIGELREMIGQLAGAAAVKAPPQLWSMIEQHLDKTPSSRPTRNPLWWSRRPIAAAASIAVLIGAAALLGSWLISGPDVAKADEVNFALLLDGLATNVDSSLTRFLQYHKAEPISAESAHAAAPDLRFAIPADLPHNFRLQQTYRFQLGTRTGLVACYKRGQEPLIVFLHQPTNKERFGVRSEMSCLVEGREVHSVEAGPWRLVHFTDPTTCHCVLSTLDTEKELPAVFAAIAPEFKTSSGRHGH